MTARRLSCCLALAAIAAAVAAQDKFPPPYNSEKDAAARPLPPADAAKGFQTPPGFKVDVFAAEPEVRNPIAMAWDTRGRLWVAENYTYAERPTRFDLNLRDRVLIFEDRDGDGKPEKRTVFIDTVQRLTGLAVGRGGVWLMCPPQLLFVPDRDGDDKPDGPPEVVLDGFEVPRENYHNFANGLKWGPDGWLYGRCGASAPGQIRRPDRPPAEAVPLAGTVWRYHPTRKVFEALASGCTNPWGHDWDADGEPFFINTVNGHLWHLIPGAHYRRPHTIDPNPLAYAPIEQHADHWHWDAGKTEWNEPSAKGNANSDKFGGGHAHSGCLIYQGTQWPAAYRGKLLTLNFHGRRVNVDRLERSGSGYVGRHEPDILRSVDPFFRGLELDTGPDGGVYILDWSDTGECHENTGVHRESGRIFRVTHGDVKPTPTPDLTKLPVEELTRLALAPGDAWSERMARLELLNRQKTPVPDAIVDGDRPRAVVLRDLWLRHSQGAPVKNLEVLMYHPDKHVRAWALRIFLDELPLDTVMSRVRVADDAVPAETVAKLVDLARRDDSGLVRLTLASALQRLPVKHRPALAAALLAREEDAADHNLPCMIWYGLIPVALDDPAALVPLAADAKIPAVRVWAARRLAEIQSTNPGPLDALLAAAAGKPEGVRREVVTGMTAGFAGVRKAAPPPAWKAFSKAFTGPDADAMAAAARNLDVVFGDGRALTEVRRLALDPKADLNLRKTALRTLIEAKPDDLRAVCESLLKTRFLNAVAMQGLTRFDDPAVGKLIAASYRTFHPTERPAVIEALVSRPTFAAHLLDVMEAGTIPRADLSAAQVRQIRGFNDAALAKRLTAVWGELRDSPKDKADQIARLKADLTPARVAAADRGKGRQVFTTTCASCHRLFGTGGDIGPDLTGAGRKDLDYLLSNVVDPSAVVNKDYMMTVFRLADGRVVSGIVTAETPKAVTVQTATERVVLAKEDVEKRTPSTQSLMPDGLLQPLSPEQVADLIAYLMADAQVELPR
jgi:putative membrane-bound dehydrogenase-like protein